jgi:quercetin dioxygenase-like cupin family protein
MTLTPAELEEFARSLGAQPQRWRELVRHDPEQRVYAQIWDGEEVNAWLICWMDGQETGFHDHDESAAALFVVEGLVREERLRLGGEPSRRVYRAGESVVVPAVAIHSVAHAGALPAISIHAYSPPLRRTGTYTVGDDGGIERKAQPYEQELKAQPIQVGSLR